MYQYSEQDWLLTIYWIDERRKTVVIGDGRHLPPVEKIDERNNFARHFLFQKQRVKVTTSYVLPFRESFKRMGLKP